MANDGFKFRPPETNDANKCSASGIVGEVMRRWPEKPAGVADQIAQAADAGAWAILSPG